MINQLNAHPKTRNKRRIKQGIPLDRMVMRHYRESVLLCRYGNMEFSA